jgi:heat shock protein HtpX
MKQVTLLILTNFAVLMMLSALLAVLRVLGVIPPNFGLESYAGMFVLSALMGFGGAFISLAMSKSMAKRSTGAQVITQPQNETERWLLATVQKQAQGAGIEMPEVAIYRSNTMNAFATGMSKNSSLVAVSTGLLSQMTRDEVEAVLAHEVSHAANGDMTTLTLVQGVTNTFVYFLPRVLGDIIDSAISRGERRRGRGPAYFLIVMAMQFLLGILATIIVRWFSRYREFKADAGAAQLAGAPKMISALRRLQSGAPPELPANMEAMGISGNMGALFATHPPLEKRIAMLGGATAQRTGTWGN